MGKNKNEKLSCTGETNMQLIENRKYSLKKDVKNLYTITNKQKANKHLTGIK